MEVIQYSEKRDILEPSAGTNPVFRDLPDKQGRGRIGEAEVIPYSALQAR